MNFEELKKIAKDLDIPAIIGISNEKIYVFNINADISELKDGVIYIHPDDSAYAGTEVKIDRLTLPKITQKWVIIPADVREKSTIIYKISKPVNGWIVVEYDTGDYYATLDDVIEAKYKGGSIERIADYRY